MTTVLTETQGHVRIITLNRVSKHNAFDDVILSELQYALNCAIDNPIIRVILLQAHGQHFSAGADLAWMQRMANFSETENLADAKAFAQVMYTLYHSPKPTIAMVQGAAIGGGAGLVAACDVGIAAHTAWFCFSETKLGLIPAVISPYVIKAIGPRAATCLFMSAEFFSAQRAVELNLVHQSVPDDELATYAFDYAHSISQHAPMAVRAAKALVREVAYKPINQELQQMTAEMIAKQRVSAEGQCGLRAFLNKETPIWN